MSSYYDGVCINCDHSMTIQLGISLHSSKGGIISKKCTECDCEHPSLDDSGR